MRLHSRAAPLALLIAAVSAAGLSACGQGSGSQTFGALEERFPRAVQTRVLTADRALGDDRRLEAIGLYTLLLEDRPDSPYLHAQIGRAFSRAGRHEEALASFERALALAPGDAATALERIGALERLGRREEALAAALALAGTPEIAPGDDALRGRLLAATGRLLASSGRHEEALSVLERAVAADPGGAAAWSALGGTLAGLGRGSESDEAFRRALRAEPCSLEALHGAAVNARTGLGREDLAFEYAQKAIDCPVLRDVRDKAPFFRMRAELQLARGDAEAALFSLSAALEAGHGERDWCGAGSPFAAALAGREEFTFLREEFCDEEPVAAEEEDGRGDDQGDP